MVVAAVIALGATALGTALGLLPGSSPRAAGPFRTAAMVTSLAVVLGQLLPESLGRVGVWGLLAFVLGYVAPRLAERLATALRKPACEHEDAMCTDLGLELGYVGLLLHSIGDGVGLGLYAGPLHEGHGHYDVVFAIAGHTVPVAALVALAFKTHRGAANAALRAVGVAAATLLGMVFASAIDPVFLATVEPWITAVVSGLLLHIVTHGWPLEGKPTLLSRVMDFAAIAAGLALVAFSGHGTVHEHGHGHGGHGGHDEHGALDMRGEMASALLDLGLETAPMLLLGLFIAAILQTQGSRIPASVLRGGSRVGQALRGALIGMPLPVCACGILPVAHGLRARGGAVAFVVTFLLATPELGIDTLALSVRFLGWPLALARILGALLVSVVAGYVVSRVVAAAAPHEHLHEQLAAQSAPDDRPFAAAHETRGFAQQVFAHFDELLYHVGAWTVVGLLAAAYLQATVAGDTLSALSSSGADVVLVTLLAMPSYVCAASATPLAAVMLAKGVSQGAVLTGLLLGPATNMATLAWLRAAYGARAALLGIGALVLTTWALAAAANVLLPLPAAVVPGAPVEHAHGAFAYASVVALVVLMLRAVWRTGLRVWLGSLGEAMGHDHGHDHSHGLALGGAGAQPGGHSHDHAHSHDDHAHDDHAHDPPGAEHAHASPSGRVTAR